MDLRYALVLADIKRTPLYLNSIKYALENKILNLMFKFEGLITLPEAVELYKLSKRIHKNSLVVELGCFKGLSSSFILAGLKSNNGHLYSIDPFSEDLTKLKKVINKYNNNYYKKVEENALWKKITLNTVDVKLKNYGFKSFTLIKGYSFEVVKKWKRRIDMLWIDASHDYKDVKRDYLEWIPYLKKGGIIAFHDANKKDQSEYWKWGWKGPTRVVNEYLKEPKWVNIVRVESLVYATKNY